ncbi:cyanophycinase [Streptomyces zhihengii]
MLTAASVPESQDPNADDPDTCSNSACNGAYYADLFRRHGAADAQWIPIDLDHIANAESDAVVAQVNSMTGFFFGGGDQYRYVTSLLRGAEHTDSKVLAVIRTKLAEGAVVAGSSAGAQIAAGPDMVTGGESYEGLRDGSAAGYFDDPTRLGHLPEGGFGFLRSGLVDTHTGAYGREGRALRLAADTGHDTVYALEENTALVVDHPGTSHETMRVIGPNGAAVLDLSRARTGTDARGWSLKEPGTPISPTATATTPATGSCCQPRASAPHSTRLRPGAREHGRLLLRREPLRRPVFLPHDRARPRRDPRPEQRRRHHLRIRAALHRHLHQEARVPRLDDGQDQRADPHRPGHRHRTPVSRSNGGRCRAP